MSKDKMQVMYVWEVRENGGYDGIYWTVLVKDDSEALCKVKKILLENLETEYDWDLLAKSQIEPVNNLFELSSDLSFEKKYSTLEVKKIQVI